MISFYIHDIISEALLAQGSNVMDWRFASFQELKKIYIMCML